MLGFVYIWFDRKNKRFYIGSHWGSYDDDYICSSPWMKAAYKKRPFDFKRRILAIRNDRKELYLEEQRWLNFIKPNEIKTKYYNLRLKVQDDNWFLNEDRRLSIGAKISKSKKGKVAWNRGRAASLETRKKISEAQKGKTFSIERCLKMSEDRKGRKISEEHKKSIAKGRKGIVYSDETKEKMKQSAIKRWQNMDSEQFEKARQSGLKGALKRWQKAKVVE